MSYLEGLPGGTVAGRSVTEGLSLFAALDAGDDRDAAVGTGRGHQESSGTAWLSARHDDADL